MRPLLPGQDPLRWMKVASLLPGKNHEDVRHRYQRLVYDVHKIEIAIPVRTAPLGGVHIQESFYFAYNIYMFFK